MLKKFIRHNHQLPGKPFRKNGTATFYDQYGNTDRKHYDLCIMPGRYEDFCQRKDEAQTWAKGHGFVAYPFGGRFKDLTDEQRKKVVIKNICIEFASYFDKKVAFKQYGIWYHLYPFADVALKACNADIDLTYETERTLYDLKKMFLKKPLSEQYAIVKKLQKEIPPYTGLKTSLLFLQKTSIEVPRINTKIQNRPACLAC